VQADVVTRAHYQAAAYLSGQVGYQQTLYDKLWDEHVVHIDDNGTALLYIDRQLVHEVTSPQAFEGLRLAGRRPWRVSANLAVPDHNVPTRDLAAGITDPVSRIQVETLDSNCSEFGITEFGCPIRDRGSCM
jgi:3-isopropylmalate/(R)-2-methylmalate dehydratase large subunit